MTAIDTPESAPALAREALARETLAPYVPRFVVDWARHHDGESWRVVEGSLLSADISGFTALSERLAAMGRAGAEELTDLLNRCFDHMIATAAAFGGDVLKFGGDALLILFTGAGHATRACAAAVGMRTGIAKPLMSARAGRVRLRMSQGIHSGAFTSFLLDGTHRELLVTGPGATATVACESAANAGEIMLSHDAAALVDKAWLGDERPDGWVLRRRTISVDEVIDLAGDGLATVDLHRFVPEAQREQIAAGVRGEHRQATIAFVKFAGTDALIEREGPGALAERLARVNDVLTAAADENGVHRLATDVYPDGGKFILTAGVPSSSGHDEDDMLHTLRRLLDSDPPLDLRVGVNRGPVFVGDLGSGTRRTFTVMGDAVNLAARLMQKAASNELVASRAVLERADSRFATVELEPFFVKGKSQAIAASVVHEVQLATRVVDESEHAPFVARETELARLRAALDAATAGKAYPVEIVGEPGIGKSRLMEEFKRRARPPAMLTITCGQYLRSTPYLAVRPLLRTLAGIPGDADRVDAGERLQALVTDVAPALLPWLPLLAIPFDADVAATPEAERIAPEFRRARLERALIDLLAVVMPATGVLFVEDAHWLDDASHGLLVELVGTDRRGSWLTIWTRRPGADVLPANVHVERIDLTPLGASDADELARVLAEEHHGLAPTDVAALAERAGGNPLFVIELVAAAAERGSTEALPDSIEQLLTSRIDTLGPHDRLLLRDASVLGARVDTFVLAEAIDDESIRAVDRWDPLNAFVAPDEGANMRFRHALFRAAAYEGLSYRRRVYVHSAVGEVIERHATDPQAVAGLLSLHFDACADHERAFRYSLMAGDDARAKYANVEAAEFYLRALRNAADAGVPPEEIAAVAEALGDASELLGRYNEADVAYARARKDTSDPVTFVRLLRKQATLRERGSRYTQAVRWLGRARRQALGDNDAGAQDENLIDIAIIYSGVRYRQGRYAESIEWARRAEADARRTGDRRNLAHALHLIDLALLSYPASQRGNESREALDIYEELDDLVGQTSVLSNLALEAHQAGRWDEAVTLNRRSQRVAEQAGDVGSAALALCNLGEVLCDQGRLDEARAALRESMRIARAANYQILIAATTLYLGRTEARAGNTVEALELLDDALARFRAMNAPSFVLDAQVHQAECLVALGRSADALALTDAVIDGIGQGEHDPSLRSALYRARARALFAACDIEGAASAIAHARHLAELADAPSEVAASLVTAADIAEVTGAPAEPLRAEAARIFATLGVLGSEAQLLEQ